LIFSSFLLFPMVVQVYILYSSMSDQYYVGYTKDLGERISMHRTGALKGSYTTKTKDWELYFSYECESIAQARRIEQHIKRMKSRKYIENLRRYPEIIQKLLMKYGH